MSWTDFMPVLHDDTVDLCENNVDAQFKKAHLSEFSINRIINPLKKSNILSISLFFKPANQSNNEIPIVSEDVLKHPESYGLGVRYNPWEHYVQPLLTYGPQLAKIPDLAIRIYLANDLGFLIERLAQFAEIYYMDSSSSRSGPGMLWRFLPLSNVDETVTIIDADLMETAGPKVNLTKQLAKENLGIWRCPVPYDFNLNTMTYRPIAGCYWGSRVSLPIEKLLLAHRWAVDNGILPTVCRHPHHGNQLFPMFGGKWPDYGCDEFFLSTTVFPRLIRYGCLTLMPFGSSSVFFPLDIEYCTWSNQNSALNYNLHKVVARTSAAQVERTSKARHFSSPQGLLETIPLKRLAVGQFSLVPEGWEHVKMPFECVKDALYRNHGVVQYIALRHVINLMVPRDVQKLFRLCIAVLPTGGVLRIAFIDPERISKYGNDDYLAQYGLRRRHITDKSDAIHDILKGNLRSHWTEFLIIELLTSIGFVVDKAGRGQSFYEDLRGIDSDIPIEDIFLDDVETCYIDAKKP